jgi:hypothetical protein
MARRIKLDVDVDELEKVNMSISEDAVERGKFLEAPRAYLLEHGIDVADELISKEPEFVMTYDRQRHKEVASTVAIITIFMPAERLRGRLR